MCKTYSYFSVFRAEILCRDVQGPDPDSGASRDAHVERAECPPMLTCQAGCYMVHDNATDSYMSQERLDHPSAIGFDNIFLAFFTQFGVMRASGLAVSTRVGYV